MATERKYICAFTAMGNTYPEFVNVSQYGDEIEISGREKAGPDGKEGKSFSVRLPKVVFEIMLSDAQNNLLGPN